MPAERVMGKLQDFNNRCWHAYEVLYVWSNREPVLTIRRVLWILTAGWALAAYYVLAGVGMITSLVFIPFAPAAFRFALFALDTVTQENYIEVNPHGNDRPWYKRPAHPFCVIANVVWLIFFGWQLALAHLAAALVQALTIVGITTAITNVQLATFALWPFGQSIRRRFLPKTIEELHAHEAAQHREPLLEQHPDQDAAPDDGRTVGEEGHVSDLRINHSGDV